MPLLVIHKTIPVDELKPLARSLCATYRVKKTHITLETHTAISHSIVTTLSKTLSTDVNLLPTAFNPDAAFLLIMDMDSTLISIECIDEIADFIGRKEEVAQITEAAMRGEIDFKESLTQRVALLKGVEETVLDQVYQERLQLNPGAEALIRGLHDREFYTALVSGGFTFFTEKLKLRLDFDDTLANQLEIVNGQLTGKILGEIVDAAAKAEFLLALCQRLQIKPSQAIAVGDGANDLQMMAEAGLSIAYHAKPAVQAKADIQLNNSGLDAILDIIDARHP